ncbi:hypothetical protein EDC01DRAFT_632049 [Geopyxis carbonaria]|nr:hypothetical protein EDC01DRAFT_632049 [Geopyxis carbonaria]
MEFFKVYKKRAMAIFTRRPAAPITAATLAAPVLDLDLALRYATTAEDLIAALNTLLTSLLPLATTNSTDRASPATYKHRATLYYLFARLIGAASLLTLDAAKAEARFAAAGFCTLLPPATSHFWAHRPALSMIRAQLATLDRVLRVREPDAVLRAVDGVDMAGLEAVFEMIRAGAAWGVQGEELKRRAKLRLAVLEEGYFAGEEEVAELEFAREVRRQMGRRAVPRALRMRRGWGGQIVRAV